MSVTVTLINVSSVSIDSNKHLQFNMYMPLVAIMLFNVIVVKLQLIDIS